MAVWPPKLVSVTLYSSLTSTLSSAALTALSSRVRGVGQWKVKEGKNLFRYLVGTEEGDAEEVAALGAHQALSWTLHFFFCREGNVWKTAAPTPTLTPNTSGEASLANNTGRRIPGPNCMLTERWDEAGLNRERR